MGSDRDQARDGLRSSLQEYLRGGAGGLLFSLPMLYTMEVWWHGFKAGAASMVLAMVVSYVLLLAYNRYAGLRADASWAEVAIDSVEEMGIGLLVSAGALYLLGQLPPESSFVERLGKVVIEGMVIGIGVSIGTAQLNQPMDDDAGMTDDHRSADEPIGFIGQVVLAVCGAFVISANIGPTEEVLLIALDVTPAKLLGLVGCSILAAAVIVFFANFEGSQRRIAKGWEIGVVALTTYGVALATAAAQLWFFGRFAGNPVDLIAAQTVVLGVPAVLGASAGRLLLQPE